MSNPSRTSLPLAWSAKALRTTEQPISFLIAEAMRRPSMVNFAAGLVDPWALPVDACGEITRAIFSSVDRGRAALQYDTTVGLKDLRRLCHTHLAELEQKSPQQLAYSADDILITNGSQQGLYIIGDVLVDPGDIVIAANPSYFVYAGALRSLGAKVMCVPMDQDGMDVDAVERLLEKLDRQGQLEKVKFIYCTSYFDNPTGLSLSAARRPRLLEIARKFSRRHRILILEDAAYRELRFDGPALPPIKSYDTDNLFVASSHTFSKPFAPGLKLGYTAMPKDLHHAVLQQKGNHDFGSSSLAMHIAAEALSGGAYAKQVELLKKTYRFKCEKVIAALTRHFGVTGDGIGSPSSDARDPAHPIHWTHPNGGLYVWLTLPPELDTSREGPLFAAAVEAGVLYVPGEYCFQPDEQGHIPKNHLRLCFGQVHPDQVEPGVEILSRVVEEALSRKAPPPAAARVGAPV